MRVNCEANFSQQFPFVNRARLDQFLLWRGLQEKCLVDLVEEREKRLMGEEPYREGFVKWAQ